MGVFPKEFHLVGPMRGSSETPVVVGIENPRALHDCFFLTRISSSADAGPGGHAQPAEPIDPDPVPAQAREERVGDGNRDGGEEAHGSAARR